MSLPLKQYWDLLARHIQPQRGRFALLTLLLLGNIALQVINPQIMRGFIDAALGGGSMDQLMSAAAVFIGIALVQQVVAVSVTYLGENVAWTATNALRAELAWHCLNLDMSFHNEHTPGELIERIDGDVTEMSKFFSQFVVTLLGNALLMIGVLIALLRENASAGIAFTICAAVAMLVLNRVRDLAMPHQKARRQAEADLFGFVEEQLNGTEDIRSSGAVDFSLRELQRLQGEVLRHDRKGHQKRWIISDVVMGVVFFASNALAVLSGYFLFTAGAITIGTVYLFIHYMNLLEQPLWMLTREVESFQTIGACIERLSELRKIQPKVQEPLPEATAGSSAGTGANGSAAVGAYALTEQKPLGLTFENVSFGYQDDETVLSGLSFHLQPGAVLGLLGRTGSGKTTLTRLVFRLYDPTAGQILLDGKNLRDNPLQALRRRVAIVTQEVQLFRASVRDNLTFFDRSISDEQIEAVIEELELGDWYRSLPQGLDTQIETGGHSLSAGEAQLLAFTRIFLRNPGLVILDEASSRLDPLTEQRIERAIDKLLRNRTAIIIAHRLHTVQRADEIMILEDGKVSEHGCREQLANDTGSRFYSLLQTGLEEVLA